MNCPMKELLKETTTTGASSTTATTKSSVYANAATTKTCVYASTTTAATASTAAGKKGVNSCVNSYVNSPAAGKIACADCCALLAFKYIAACEDVVEFQRKVKEVMRKR